MKLYGKKKTDIYLYHIQQIHLKCYLRHIEHIHLKCRIISLGLKKQKIKNKKKKEKAIFIE